MFSFVFDKFSLKLSELIEQILTDNVIPSTDNRYLIYDQYIRN